MVVVTVERLTELVREQVDAALAEHARDHTPQALLVGPSEMAALIDVSRTTLHRLREDGCPCVRVGDTFKYEPEAVLSWLRGRA